MNKEFKTILEEVVEKNKLIQKKMDDIEKSIDKIEEKVRTEEKDRTYR